MLTVFTVNTIADEAFDGTGNDGTDGAGLSLREAIGLANSNTIADAAGQGEADGDVIVFDPALAGLTITISGTALTITDDVVINGNAGTAGTRVTVDGGDAVGIFVIATMDSDGVSDAVVLQNLIVQNGNSATGGGITNAVGSPTTLNNVAVQDNNATVDGGGIANLGTLTIQGGSLLSGNSAAVNGGAILNQGTLSIDASTIQANTASGPAATNGGGGIYSVSGTVSITGSTVTGNVANGTAGSGGGIFITAGTVTIDQSLIDANTANRAGGGIEIVAGTLDITGTDLSNNVTLGGAVGAPGNGGALHVSGAATTIITGGTVSGNSAANEGGGLWNSGGGSMTVDGVLIIGNTAAVEGGGIFNNGGTLNVTGSTIGDSIIDNDVFSTAASADDLVFAFVDTQDSTAGTGVFLDILENDGTTIIDNLNAGISAGQVVVQGGNVFLNVQADPLTGEEVSPYQIYAVAVNPTTAIGESEANDDFTTADPVTEDTLVTGTLGSATDVDVFSVNVAAGSSLVVILDTIFGTDAVVEILDTNGTSVLATGTVDAFSGDSAAIASGLAGGTYFVRVTGDAGATGDYAFVAMAVAPGDLVAETEPNDETADATVLAAGEFGQGSLLQVGTNTALRGGGIFNNTGGTVNVTDLTVISNNTATGNLATDGGGGIYNDGGTVTVDGFSQITFNSATVGAGSGGGIFNNTGGTLTVTDATIAGNTANRAGGGIEDASGGGFGTTLTNVGLNDNVAQGGGAGAPGNGGGLHVTGAGDISITGGTVNGNSAALEGGGLWNGAGIMTIAGTTIDGNTASGAGADDGGGGIFNNAGDVVITGATSITNNVANGAAGSGGGIFNNASGTITATGTVITGNTANRAGGGIEDAGGAGFGTTLTNVTLNNNVAQGGGVAGSPGNGGGLHVSGGGNVTITGGTVNGNSAALEGGGLWNGSGTMTIDAATINGNTASGDATDDGGGGIFNNDGVVDISNSTISNNVANGTLGHGGGILSVDTLITSNVTISGNSASGEGGGIDVESGTATINNTTIANNQAGGGGGGINVDTGTVTLNSTLVATNLSGTVASDITGTVSGTFNLVGVNTGLTGLTNGVGGNQVGTLASPINPLLGPLADNGGPTLTHNILEGSPAIDAGSNPDALDFDQRLSPFERVVGDQADVGAIELQQVLRDIIAVGTDAGEEAFVQVFDADTQMLLFTLTPYPNFTGGVRVAVGDVNFDGTPDIITAPGPNGGPHIRVFSGIDGADLGSFFAYSPAFTGGVFVASADIDGDGFADIITGPDAGGGPHVRVFSGANFSSEIASFFAFGGFAGGVRVAAGDITDDGTPDIIVGAGPGAGPHVRVFDGANPLDGNDPVVDIGGLRGSFYAFDQLFAGGVFVAGGDVDDDGQVDIIVGADAGAGPHVRVFDGETGLQLAGPIGSFYAFDQAFRGGVRVAASDVNNDGAADVVTTQGPGGEPRLRVYDGASVGTLPTLLVNTLVDDPSMTDGLFPAASVELESTTVTAALASVFSDGDLLDELV